MNCILCSNLSTNIGVYVPGNKTKMIIGSAAEGSYKTVLFGICEDHLDENGDYLEGVEQLISKTILRRVREPGVPSIDLDANEENLKSLGLDSDTLGFDSDEK